MTSWFVSKTSTCRMKNYSNCIKGHSFCAEILVFLLWVLWEVSYQVITIFKWSEKYFELTLYKGRQITSINPTCICGSSSFRSRSIIAWKYKHRDNILLFSAVGIIPPLLHTHLFMYHGHDTIWAMDNAIHMHSVPPFSSNLSPLTSFNLNCITV